jgi:lysophospholipid acyltransferase (LPLAT)-like uncharacterized protein
MDNITILLKASLVLSILGCLLYFVTKLITKYSKYHAIPGSEEHAIKIQSVIAIDHNTKIINFHCHHKNYIVLIGKNGDLIIDKYEPNPY